MLPASTAVVTAVVMAVVMAVASVAEAMAHTQAAVRNVQAEDGSRTPPGLAAIANGIAGCDGLWSPALLTAGRG